jgi:Family of unknown function (DUF6308)
MTPAPLAQYLRRQSMGSPECTGYQAAVDRIRKLAAADRADADLYTYLASYSGAKFDRLIDKRHPDEFTSGDFPAVRKLNVSVLKSARVLLLGGDKPEVQRLLHEIPRNLDTGIRRTTIGCVGMLALIAPGRSRICTCTC